MLHQQTKNSHSSPRSDEICHIQLHLLRLPNRLVILPHTRQRHLRLPLPERAYMSPGQLQHNHISARYNQGRNYPKAREQQ